MRNLEGLPITFSLKEFGVLIFDAQYAIRFRDPGGKEKVRWRQCVALLRLPGNVRPRRRSNLLRPLLEDGIRSEEAGKRQANASIS
ncbi:MAG: hypothetical protein DMG69_32235 [Acidobacteria bacterium]|nr:MAG: hypothetical protein DMG69_32235 [Acidobacteriota bacterium]